MSKKRKVMTGAMASITAAAMLATGCASKTEKPAAEASTAPTSAAKTAEPPKRTDITVTVYERNNIPPEEGTWEKNRWTEWVNKNGPHNVKYVTVPRWESLQKLNALFATSSAPDLILEYDTSYRNTWYSQKLLMPIDDIVEKYSTTYKDMMKQFPQLKKLGTKDDGKLYEIGRLSPLEAGHRVYIREDWLEKLNLKMPTSPEELLAVAKAFTTQDPDGNGKNDTFGINLSGNGLGVINHMFGHGEVDWNIDANDKFVHEWDRLKSAVDFDKKLFDAGVVDKDFLTDKNGEKAKQDFLSGKLGIYLWQFIDIKDYDTLKKNAPQAKLGLMPLPKTQYGQFSPVIGSPIQMVGAFNAKAKDPKAVMEYIDFMVKPENGIVTQKGLEGQNWQKGPNGCPQVIDAEKNKKEISWINDLGMMASTLTMGKCFFNTMRPTDTESLKVVRDLAVKADELYVSKDRPIPTLKPEYLPVLPQDLSLIIKNVEKQVSPPNIGTKGDLWLKAIVGGASYTPDQALKEAKDIWDKAGGKQVDDFYGKWYDANKTKAFMLKDLYEFGETAKKLYETK
ncbi:extracellular solute-binding protein [Gorillibacterium sp. sgz5001074]|uniref:extracellular solute-binding protein n=1 Tax=Gorillibacterium sp. sgz5001074 TaxID=3446695 RepID=UPI003F67E8E5